MRLRYINSKTMIQIKFKIAIILLIIPFSNTKAQEIGLNFNHNSEIIDFDYVKKSGVEWIRATPRILDYYNGKLNVSKSEALTKIEEAGMKGYKVAFGFRWDFVQNKMRIPKPDSKEEQALFELERKILEQVGTHVDIFKLGNEPNLETMPEDMEPEPNGEIPLVRFMQRQLEKVVIPFFKEKNNIAFPKIYVGSLPALFEEKQQKTPGVVGLIRMAQTDNRITGLALHLHIANFEQAQKSFEFARSIMPQKPIIIPEFSLHRLFLAHRTDVLGDSEAGLAFCKKYNHNPSLKIYEWCSIANSSGVSSEEWNALFESRTWYPSHFLLSYYEQFKKFGVVLATYPLFQQSCPANMQPSSPMWFINPIYLQKSLLKQSDGEYSKNPLNYEDFIKIVQTGKNK